MKSLNLTSCFETQIMPSTPFCFDGTFHKPSHFPSPDRNYQEGVYWQSMVFGKQRLGVKVVNQGAADNPGIQLSIYTQNSLPAAVYSQIVKEIEFRFDLKTDLSGFIEMGESDPVLSAAIQRWRGMRVSAGESLYEFLAITTVLQNATVRRSVQMFENLFARYGTQIRFDDRFLYAFWEPAILAEVPEQELRDLKMGYRAKTFLRQAQKYVNENYNEIELRALDNQALKENLLSFYGIGPASVWYLMFEVFKRYDALDYISPWEQKIYSKILFNTELVETKVILEEVKKRWGKWSMLAMHYLFEDLFWQRKNQSIPWLEELIRL